MEESKDFKKLKLNRKKTVLLGTISNYGATFISIIVGLISVPIGLNYFGPILYGIWIVIGSILAYLGISDFGISLSTLTLIAQTTKPSHQRIILRRSLGLFLGTSISSIGIIFVINHLFPGWVNLLGKIPSNLQEEATKATFWIGILTLLQLPLNTFVSAFSGLQQVHWNRVYGAFCSISALIALIVTILIGGNLVSLAIFTGLGSFLVKIISGIHLFITNPKIRPRLTEKVIDAPSTGYIFISGIRFLILQIAVLIIWNTDNLVISHYLGPKMVTSYALTFKLFSMGIAVTNAVTQVLWPMYGQALGLGDWKWIKETYNRCVSLLVILGGLIWIGGILFSKIIINLWVGPLGYGGLTVVFALGGYAYLCSFGGSNASLINGLNPKNIVVVFGLIEAAINLGISLVLVRPLGIGGVALGTLIANLAINSWFGPIYIQRQTKKKVSLKIQPILKHTFFAVIPGVIFAIIINLYLFNELIQIILGVAIIVLYLILSWKIMLVGLKSFSKNIFIEIYNHSKTFFVRNNKGYQI
jgi:O-antigen/teichoic acid export membrane protein